ncbi:MAG: zinc-dependent alcohol dehydrogenase family protein [Sphingobium sp.]|uniref:zinc-dependent alcohol dehydrogenase family protein n=1 Tax=Sphingobium sp. TaxID=1912891 RepID=UPI0029B300AE|nr:zinc-dependent alcohol dehydrogenase family protein [Sphingobium sp.]MDX3910941.1 zinc-dependent alcohol dehydrogenase family protein [Sphingobium sp.]
MEAMELGAVGAPLQPVTRAVPRPGTRELLIRVTACGICRTDLHIVDGEVRAHLPIIPGHEIVGVVEQVGADVHTFRPGDRVGVPWLGHSCGICDYCRAGQENLCDTPGFTGCTCDGGYATHAVADAEYCFAIPDCFSDAEAAPLLCAGLIGWRALRAAGEGKRIGLYGFGAAAHIIAQIAVWQGRDVFAFTKPEDRHGQDFARSLGCIWAGASDDPPPVRLDAAILFAPVGALVPQALQAIRKGGSVICAGIHMSDIPQFSYQDLWGERSIRSIANLTREDGESFFAIAQQAQVKTRTTSFPLRQANAALAALRAGTLDGAAVLIPLP